ncbi:MAG TPA: patatin-like phospholipase family protein [Niabella sp.]|nr:patatin-like phospholipase family protein [Niabella sp.]
MKQALVISGGGSKGAFSVGVIKDLVHIYQASFDVLVGTSTGALIAPLVALGEIAQLEKLYTTVTDADIIVKYNIGRRLGTTSIFTAGPLTAKIDALYTDEFFKKLQDSGKEVYLTTVCLQTEELVVFTTASNPVESNYYTTRKIVNADQFRRAVLASASQPVFMPPIKINKHVPGERFPEYQFVDGGVREYAGLGIAIDAGAEEIFTIAHSAKNFVPASGEFSDLFSVLEQTIAMFITDVAANDIYLPRKYNEALTYIQKVKEKMKSAGIPETDIEKYFTVDNIPGSYQNKKPLKIHIIQPEDNLGGGPGGLVFDPIEMKGMVAKGQMALQSYVANLTPGDIHWA